MVPATTIERVGAIRPLRSEQMISSPRNGAPPPHGNLTDAGDAEADSMIGRFGYVARKKWTAAVGFLALLLLVAFPGVSSARPYSLAGGSDQDGDPTAD